jgi:fructokinase
MSAFPRAVALVGEALVDIVHRPDGTVQEHPGGSPANVALALGRLGRKPQLVTSLAADDRGRVVTGWLEEAGVDVAAAAPTSGRTSTAMARLDATGAAHYVFDIEWQVDAELAEESSVLHVGSIGAYLEPGASGVESLVRHRRAMSTITFDPNIRPALIADPAAVRERVMQLVAIADVIKASDEDVRWLYPGRDIAEIAEEWHAAGAAIVVMTLGEKGARGSADCGVVSVSPVATTVSDTVGAGDTFMGALIDGLIEERLVGADRRDALRSIGADRLQAVLDRSAAAAAITVARPGTDPPWRGELADLRPT